MSVGNWAAAIAEFRTESTIRPRSAEPLYYMGIALRRQGHPAEALEALDHADQLAPNIPGTLLEAGQAAFQAGDSARAEKYLTALIGIQKEGPLAADAHAQLADVYRKAGKTAEADRELAESVRLKGGPKK